MAAALLSILLVGDSHIAAFPAHTYGLTGGAARQFSAMTRAAYIGAAYIALDIVVRFPDDRLGLNPLFDLALEGWPGLDVKGRPLTPVESVRKHLVMSLGTGLSSYDPAIDFDDRSTHSLLFKPDIDFILPAHAELPLDPTCTVLPVALIRDMFTTILEPTRKALAFLACEYPDRLWIIGSPPPSENNAVKQSTFASRAQRFGTQPLALPSPAVSLKLWLLVNECVRAICNETHCRFIDCTPIASNEHGFLRPEFEHDGVHGNARYNELMGRHIASTLGAAEAGLSS